MYLNLKYETISIFHGQLSKWLDGRFILKMENERKQDKTVHKQRRCTERQIYNQSIRDRKQRKEIIKTKKYT